MINYNMNKFLKEIHKNYLIIYKQNNQYFVVDHFVYLFKSLFQFNFLIKNNRKIILIDECYINYILKKLRENNISYVVIHINYGYDILLKYKTTNNQYKNYYQQGKNIIKNENKINYLIKLLETKRNINLLQKIESVIQNG